MLMAIRNIRTLQRRKEKKRFFLLVVPPLIFIVLCLAVFLLARHFLHVREVVFSNNHHLKNEELSALTGIKKNSGLFDMSGRQIYRNLKKSPWIKDAVIRKELSGRILIRVTEHIPVALLMVEDKPFLVDDEGNPLEQMKEGAILLLPVIKGIDPNKDKETYAEAIKFVRVLHDKRVVSYQGEIEITGQRPEDITLKVDKIMIKVGMGDFEKKLQRLDFVRDEINRRNMNVEYIDLRFANKIIVKQAGQEVQSGETIEAVHDNGKKKKK